MVFCPVDIQVSQGKIALREDLESNFIHVEINVTKTDNVVALKHPDKQNLNTKAVLNDLFYRIKKLLITDILVLTALLLQCGQ